jgi:hypothetical protein
LDAFSAQGWLKSWVALTTASPTFTSRSLARQSTDGAFKKLPKSGRVEIMLQSLFGRSTTPKIFEKFAFQCFQSEVSSSIPFVPTSTQFTSELDVGVLPTQGLLDNVNNNTGSEETCATIRDWIKECTESHPQCARRHKDRDLVPTRLLDLGPAHSSWPTNLVRLVETGSGFREPYMTLSHSWGKNPKFLELRENNLNFFKRSGLPWNRLAKNTNFKEAIEVARKLHVRYLWIDSLCIIQKQKKKKEDDVLDWDKEAQLMHRYYRNSWCNIVASDSKDADGGLFREYTKRKSWMRPARYSSSNWSPFFGDGSWYIVVEDLWSKCLLDSFIYTRGWVFQGK